MWGMKDLGLWKSFDHLKNDGVGTWGRLAMARGSIVDGWESGRVEAPLFDGVVIFVEQQRKMINRFRKLPRRSSQLTGSKDFYVEGVLKGVW